MTDAGSDRARRRLERERKARLEAETIAERVTADMYAAVSELERVNERLHVANADLERANEAVRDFVAIAAHDIRGPLTSVLGFTQILRTRWDQLDEAQKVEFLDVIEQQGSRIQRLADDLLIISEIEAGGMEAHVAELCVGPEVCRAVDAIGAEAASVRITAAADLVVLGDASHLHRIVANYVTNSLKYGRPPIVVEALDAGRFVELRVRDHGDGVPAEFAPRLFAKFARASTERAGDKPGTGLGLAIVRGLARANGGDAWYERNVPSGSCFGVSLPKA